MNFDQLDELKTFVTYANDEGDPGMGLQLGLDMFAFSDHKLLQREAYRMLSMAYTLLDRSVFCDVVKLHLKKRYRFFFFFFFLPVPVFLAHFCCLLVLAELCCVAEIFL